MPTGPSKEESQSLSSRGVEKGLAAEDGNARCWRESMIGTSPGTEFHISVGDCLEGMRKLLSESVDLVVTSPPYNIGIRYNSYEDRKSRADYLEWMRMWATEVKRVLKPDGSFFLNLGSAPTKPLFPHEAIVELSSLFVLQNTFHWIKSISLQTRDRGMLSMGHFKPINSRRFVNDCHEFVFHLTKNGAAPLDRLALGVPYADKSNINRWKHSDNRDLRCRGNIWFIPYKTIRDRRNERPHPATFPTELATHCIKIHGGISDLVMLDPFLGIGHTAIAAMECGVRKFIGFEIDPEYVNAAKAQVAAFQEEQFKAGRAFPC